MRTCPDCAHPADFRTCCVCGAQDWVIDCGHFPQPRPLASGRSDGSDLGSIYCEDCADAGTRPGWLDLSRALTALATLRRELQALLALNPSRPQLEALRDALGALGLVERDLRDAEPPEGEHPGDRDANVCSSCLATYALELAACPECEVAP